MITLLFTILASLGLLAAPAMDDLPQPANTPAFVVVEQAGTTTINVVDETGAVSGTMITKDGESFTFGPKACEPVLVGEDDGLDYSALFDAGYAGNAADGLEAVYAPGC